MKKIILKKITLIVVVVIATVLMYSCEKETFREAEFTGYFYCIKQNYKESTTNKLIIAGFWEESFRELMLSGIYGNNTEYKIYGNIPENFQTYDTLHVKISLKVLKPSKTMPFTYYPDVAQINWIEKIE